MAPQITIARDSICVDVRGAKNCDADFVELCAHMKRGGIIFFVGASDSDSFSVKCDCRWDEDVKDRTWWATKRRALLGILTMWCAEKYGCVSVIRRAGHIDGIDLSKTTNQEKKS